MQEVVGSNPIGSIVRGGVAAMDGCGDAADSIFAGGVEFIVGLFTGAGAVWMAGFTCATKMQAHHTAASAV